MSRHARILLGAASVAALVVAFVLAWAGRRSTPHEGPRGSTAVVSARLPNLLLVTIDTLRADRVGAYGHTGETTPTFDRLALTGARFASAYATSSWTAPSMVSMLAGVYPSRHGVTEGVVRDGSVQGQQHVPDDLPLLAERLRQRGYRTFGIVANAHLHPSFGFARGFDRFECLGFARAPGVLGTLTAWKDEIAATRPWFLWVHLFDPHAPYVPDGAWLASHWDPRARIADLEHVHPARRYETMAVYGERLAYVDALYRGSIRAADDALGRVLQLLDAERQALIVVTSDHGEELAEHGRFDHGHSLYEELVRVPLVLRFPERSFAGRVVDEPVSLVDLLPTLAEIARFEPPRELHGRSLLPLLRGEHGEARAIVAELSRGEKLAMRREGRHKLIRDLRAPERSMLFDLGADSAELVNAYSSEGSRASEIEQRLLDDRVRWARTAPARITPLDPGQVESMRSMGYVE